MKANLREKIKKIIASYLKKEATTSSAVPGVMTPFAFSKKGARPETLKQGGYSLANVSKHKSDMDENQMYSEPSYSTPSLNIEPVQTFKNKDGLVQHNDPELDPNLVGFKQGQLPMTEISYKQLFEGINGLKYEQENQPIGNPTLKQPADQQVNQNQMDLKSYDIQTDFSDFDRKMKNSTEELKINLQKTIQDKILGKKVVVRAAKGYKQPEADYTINVTGVAIDYYYDRYVIIIIGREENKQKVSKFFVKPGFKIKILGSASGLKPKDQYQLSKSRALVEPQTSTGKTNTVTGDEENETPTPETQSTPETPEEKPLSEMSSVDETFKKHLNLTKNKLNI